MSLLEIQMLSESGRIEAKPEFAEAVLSDTRFVVDEVPLVALVQKSLQLGWTRDPFDRFIVAHSLFRRIPLCSLDGVIASNYKLIVYELR